MFGSYGSILYFCSLDCSGKSNTMTSTTAFLNKEDPPIKILKSGKVKDTKKIGDYQLF